MAAVPATLAREGEVYLRLAWMQIRSQAQYKTSVAIDIGTYFLVTALEFSAVLLVFTAFPELLGWRPGEVVLLYGVVSVSFGLAELFGAGIDAFDQTIRLGEFDRVLLRPVAALTQVAGADFRLRRLGRLSTGVLVVALGLRMTPGIRWDVSRVLAEALGIVSGGLIFVAVMLLGATVCFWTVETTEFTNIFTYGGREMLGYPLTVYQRGLQAIFLFVVPLALGTYTPTCYLLGKPLPFGLPPAIAYAAPPAALAFALASVAIWRLGVRHYQSTGS